MLRILLKEMGAFGNADISGAWLSSAHAFGTLSKLPDISWRKVRMTSSHHASYALGNTRATMDRTEDRDLAKAATRLHEAKIARGSLNAFLFLLIGVISQILAMVKKKGEQALLESAVQRIVVCCIREG
ncbi:F-box/LRR-repeat protein 3 [Spatholobus suberectus]|nr:F-box/LRR-repeat protein 3 [Spatholobus suberectus]